MTILLTKYIYMYVELEIPECLKFSIVVIICF
jgi:hypothetical protein